MELSPELIREILSEFFDRTETIKMLGGISMKEVVEGRAVPNGWVLDQETDFYIPATAYLVASKDN